MIRRRMHNFTQTREFEYAVCNGNCLLRALAAEKNKTGKRSVVSRLPYTRKSEKMNEIKYPRCRQTFKLDEAGYAAIAAQVRSQQLEDAV